MKTVFRIFLLALLPCISFAQDFKRTYNWYFGYGSGLSFRIDTIIVLKDGQINTHEGSAIVSFE